MAAVKVVPSSAETVQRRKIFMRSSQQPSFADFRYLKELVDGKPADKMAMERLKSCKWVEEINGTALLTRSGVKAAMKLT